MATVVATGPAADELSEAPRLPDALLAVTLLVVAQVDLRLDLDNSTHYGPAFATEVVVVVATLSLAWRRSRPFGTLCVVAAVIAVPNLFGALTFSLWGHFAPLLVAAYSAARWCRPPQALAAAALVAVTIAVVLLRVPAAGTAGNIPFATVPAAVVMLTGRALSRRQLHAVELADRAHRLEADREVDVAAALAEERARIARELHDVVAHCVSVMVVQAGAAEAFLDRSPQSAREPLQEVQATGQQAISELTRMLGLLRGSSEGPAHELAPQPGADQLPELVERLTAAGLDVRLTTAGAPYPLPPGLDLTVFRIVQEALTNTLKHAGPGSRADVELRYLPHTLEIEVRDDGRATDWPARGGHGLIGMAERVSLFGGSIETGPRAGGGFQVLVALPVEHR